MKMVRAILLVCLISAVVMAKQLAPDSQKLLAKGGSSEVNGHIENTNNANLPNAASHAEQGKSLAALKAAAALLSLKPTPGQTDPVVTGPIVSTSEPVSASVSAPLRDLNCDGDVKKRYAELAEALKTTSEHLTVIQQQQKQVLIYLRDNCFGFTCPEGDPSEAIQQLQDQRKITLLPVPIDQVPKVREVQAEIDRHLSFLTEVCLPRYQDRMKDYNCEGDVPQRIAGLLNLIEYTKVHEGIKDEWRKLVAWLKENCLSYNCKQYKKRVAELNEKINSLPQQIRMPAITVYHVERDWLLEYCPDNAHKDKCRGAQQIAYRAFELARKKSTGSAVSAKLMEFVKWSVNTCGVNIPKAGSDRPIRP